MAPSSRSSNSGQVVEYIPGIFYFPFRIRLHLHIRIILPSKHRPSHIYYSPLAMTQTKLGDSTSPGRSFTTHALYPSLLFNAEAFPVTLLTIADRLYLASYLHPPNADTVFPYSEQPQSRSPGKRSQRAVDGPAPVPSKADRHPPYYFTVDDMLLYNAFHHDFGPLHIGHLYRFALYFHDILGAKENQHRPIVFWSRADPRSR